MPRRAAVALLAAALALAGASPGAAGPRTSVLDLPAIAEEIGAALRLDAGGERAAALERLGALAGRHPDQPDIHAARALVLAGAGRPDAAFESLERAVASGYGGLSGLARHPRIAPLARAPRFGRLLARAGKAAPEPAHARPAEPALVSVERQEAPVRAENTEWRPDGRALRSLFRVPPVLARRPVARARGPLEGVAPFLNHWYAEGRAAGLAGVLYDNRDRAHSRIARALFPQLLHVAYGPEVRARGLDYGAQRHFEFERIAFGNSSTAIVKGPLWRSQTRRLLTSPGGPERLFRQYVRNQIYVYPEKSDHGPEQGDLFPANTPYTITSEGASGSDGPFLRLIAVALAAMRPATREALEARGLIAPALQMILRRAQTGVETDADYLSGRAHPAAFDGARLDLAAAATRAQALEPGGIPPMVRLTLLAETLGGEPRGVFAEGLDESLLETPSAIARIFRDAAPRRTYLLSARGTRDPNGRPLAFRWVLLRGDAERVAIRPQTADNGIVEIEVEWQDPGPVPGRPEIAGRRLDIGVFADNGAELSAPAFFSVAFPPGQTRRLAPDGRVLEIDHTGGGYADPLLFPRRDWSDRFAHDADGRLLGWTRTYADGREEGYTADGARVLSRDAAGRPREAERVRHVTARRERMRAVIAVEPTGERLRYLYDGPEDRVGRAVPAE